jgi:hypothetical protein
MALRVFVDAKGTEWQAFDVVPRENERRRYDRRTSGETRADSIPATERREADRRLTIGGRTRLHSGAGAGWLCFESGGDRRRLAPIPEDWATASDEQLEDYLHAARLVRKSAAINPRR